VEEEDLLRLRGASSVSSRQQTINVTDSNVTGIKISRISIYIYRTTDMPTWREKVFRNNSKEYLNLTLHFCLEILSSFLWFTFPKKKKS